MYDLAYENRCASWEDEKVRLLKEAAASILEEVREFLPASFKDYEDDSLATDLYRVLDWGEMELVDWDEDTPMLAGPGFLADHLVAYYAD